MNENRPIDVLCSLYGVSDVKLLARLSDAIDQHLMRESEWDYNKPECGNNKLVRELEKLDRTGMTLEENYWVNQIIWFWYHHAISCALFKYFDRSAAQAFAIRALEHQERLPDHPNRITRLLYYLVFGQHDKAQQWVQSFSLDDAEADTAEGLLLDYQMAFCLKV